MSPAEVLKPPSRRQPNGELALLVQRGKDAEAALALGTTYDPLIFLQLKIYGSKPDAAMARSWYEKAAELGSLAAPRRLKTLADGVGTR